jgi:hypothetical protein
MRALNRTSQTTGQDQAELVNSSHAAQAAKQQINTPIDLDDCAYIHSLTHPCGGESLYLDLEEAKAYNADPDGFAAKHFGFTSADEYREWIETQGAALCGARTRSGKLCSNFVSRIQLNPGEWKARHRQIACHAHSKSGAVS